MMQHFPTDACRAWVADIQLVLPTTATNDDAAAHIRGTLNHFTIVWASSSHKTHSCGHCPDELGSCVNFSSLTLHLSTDPDKSLVVTVEDLVATVRPRPPIVDVRI